MEYLVHHGLVLGAIEYADNSIDYLEKLKSRFFGVEMPVVDRSLQSIKEERSKLLMRQDEFNESIKHKILWIKSYPELIECLKKQESEKLIFKSDEITFEQLALSCFYIEHYSVSSNLKLRFLKEEKYTVFFFQDLIKEHCINYNDLAPELLNKICKNCLNKKNEPYKVRQLQTLIGGLKA